MANTTRSSVVAVFDNNADAQAAVNELKSNGIDSDDIYIGSANSAPTAGKQTGYSDERSSGNTEGGFMGWLKSLFGSDDAETDRTRYQNAVSSGKILVSVQTDEANIDRATEILDRHSPVNVHEEASGVRAASTAGTSTGAAYAGTQRGASTTAQTNQGGAIPVVEEELQVGKRSVPRGGVRVYSRIVEQPVEETVHLREEKVRVQRQPVDRPATEADLRGREQQTIEVKEYAEEPVVSKQSRVVEEVRVGKDSTERTETVRDTVRRTEVEVENLDQQKVRETSSSDDLDEEDDDLRAKSATTRG